MHAAATRFPKLRRLARISAVVSPLGCFAMFLLFAADVGFWWLVLPIGLLSIASFIAMALPLMVAAGVRRKNERGEPMVHWLPGRVAWLLVYMWFVCRGDFFKWFDQIMETHALMDWRLITAAAIWTTLGIFSTVRKVNEVPDEDIFRWLSES